MSKRFALIVAIVVALSALAVPVFADTPSSEVNFYFEGRWGFVAADDLPPEGTYTVTFYCNDVQLGIQTYEFIVEFIYLWDDENEVTYGRTSDCYIPDLDATFWVECVMGYNEDDIHGISFTAYSVPSNFIVAYSFSSYSPSDPEEPGSDPGIVDSVLEVFSGLGSWISTTLLQFVSLFYSAETGLTILGLICVIPVALSICFLVFMLIVNFIKFRK